MTFLSGEIKPLSRWEDRLKTFYWHGLWLVTFVYKKYGKPLLLQITASHIFPIYTVFNYFYDWFSMQWIPGVF